MVVGGALFCEVVLPMVILPPFNSSFFNGNIGRLKKRALELAAGLASVFAPGDESADRRVVSIHRLPFLRRVTCGSTMKMSVTFSCLEKISGISSTPTLRDLAVRKGEGLNLGSSADREVVRRKRSVDQRQAEIAQLDFAAQRGGSLFLRWWA